MQIIKSTEVITVSRPTFLIYGGPGLGKSTLGYSMPDPVLLDTDQGAHRAKNRKDTIKVGSWADVAELTTREALDGPLANYRTIVPDTVGRVLDFATRDIIDESPKYGRGDGALTQQGYGVLKGRFTAWANAVSLSGKIICMLAHSKEDRDGDTTIVRPDITGGSYAEVMKKADFVGILYMQGKNRVLDFNPTDRWVGKNPANWKPFVLPEWNTPDAREFMSRRFEEGREALGRMSAEGIELATLVAEWSKVIDAFEHADEFTAAIEPANKLPKMASLQVKHLLLSRSKAVGLTFDREAKRFVAPTKPTAVHDKPPAPSTDAPATDAPAFDAKPFAPAEPAEPAADDIDDAMPSVIGRDEYVKPTEEHVVQVTREPGDETPESAERTPPASDVFRRAVEASVASRRKAKA